MLLANVVGPLDDVGRVFNKILKREYIPTDPIADPR